MGTNIKVPPSPIGSRSSRIKYQSEVTGKITSSICTHRSTRFPRFCFAVGSQPAVIGWSVDKYLLRGRKHCEVPSPLHCPESVAYALKGSYHTFNAHPHTGTALRCFLCSIVSYRVAIAPAFPGFHLLRDSNVFLVQ